MNSSIPPLLCRHNKTQEQLLLQLKIEKEKKREKKKECGVSPQRRGEFFSSAGKTA